MNFQQYRVQCLSPSGLHDMNYYQWGAPDNPRVLVCVHGLTRNGRDFDELAQHLAAHYRVICPDVVGRGLSAYLRDPAGYAVPQYVADMVTLIARLNVASIDWLGTSMGGLIGMALAAQPQTPIRRLILNDVGPYLDSAALQRIAAYVGADPAWPSFAAAQAEIERISAPFGMRTGWASSCLRALASSAFRSLYCSCGGWKPASVSATFAAVAILVRLSSGSRLSCLNSTSRKVREG